MILVTGAVGNIGKALTPMLESETGTGTSVRVLVRKPEKYRPPSEAIEVCEGHLGDKEQFEKALDGVHTLFLLSGVHPKMAALQAEAARTAAASGVRHIVKLSGMDANANSEVTLSRFHATAEAAIESTGVGFTHLRPNAFMQNLLPAARQISKTGILAAPMGEAKVSLIDSRDIAEVAAKVLLEPEKHEGKTYTLTGPQSLDYSEVASQLSSSVSSTVRYQDVPLEEARDGMVSGGMPEWWADYLVELFADTKAGNCARVTADVEEVIGRPAASFAQFAGDYAKVFVD